MTTTTMTPCSLLVQPLPTISIRLSRSRTSLDPLLNLYFLLEIWPIPTSAHIPPRVPDANPHPAPDSCPLAPPSIAFCILDRLIAIWLCILPSVFSRGQYRLPPVQTRKPHLVYEHYRADWGAWEGRQAAPSHLWPWRAC